MGHHDVLFSCLFHALSSLEQAGEVGMRSGRGKEAQRWGAAGINGQRLNFETVEWDIPESMRVPTTVIVRPLMSSKERSRLLLCAGH